MSGIKTEATQVKLIVNGVDACVAKETGVLAAGAPGVSGNDVPIMSQLPFTKEYVSAEQTITAAGLLTLAHGLGTVPKLVTTELVCKTAELNYTVGDVVNTGFFDYGGAANSTGASITKDATNLNIRYGANGCIVANKTTGVGTLITPANWRLIVRAWA